MNRRDFIRTISLTLGAVGLETTSFNVENLGFAEDKPGRKILYFDLSTEWEHPPTVDEADGTSKAAKIVKKLGEAIGYDMRLNRALYKALQASGVKIKDSGVVIVTLADEDKEEAFPLVQRFYQLGFNIEATHGTALFLKERGIRAKTLAKLSEGSDEILREIRAGYVSYVVNTRSILSGVRDDDGLEIRRCAVQNGVTMFTSLDAARILLDVLEETLPRIATI